MAVAVPAGADRVTDGTFPVPYDDTVISTSHMLTVQNHNSYIAVISYYVVLDNNTADCVAAGHRQVAPGMDAVFFEAAYCPPVNAGDHTISVWFYCNSPNIDHVEDYICVRTYMA